MPQELKSSHNTRLSYGNIGTTGLLRAGFLEALGGNEDADDRLIPVILLHPNGFVLLSFWVALGTVLGAFGLYWVGYGLFLVMGQWLVQQSVLMGEESARAFLVFQALMAEYAGLVVAAAAFSILPVRVIAVVSGFCLVNPVVFCVSALVARSVRQVVLAWLLWRGGVRYKEWIELYYHGLTTVLGVGFLLLFLLVLALVKME